MALPEIYGGMDALRRDNPWPELPTDVDPFYLSLDAGGRHLVVDVIREHGVTLMLEIGCFLCGSTRQWLDASPDLEVIGVDPWDGNWSTYIRQKTEEGHPLFAALEDPFAVADALQRYGNFRLALNNIRDVRERFVPVRRHSPEALDYLRRRGIQPQLVYIDAFKNDEDLRVAHDLFPRAILCGDDWDWSDEHGRLRMREHVEKFADEHGFAVEAEGATWLVKTPSWDATAAGALVAELDTTARDLLRVVATTAADGKSVTLDEAARRLDRGAEELLRATQRINEADAGKGRPVALGLVGSEGDGWDTLGSRPYVLAEGLAQLLPPRL